MFEITPFGLAIIVAATGALALRCEGLLFLLPVCAVLQAPAAFIVELSGTRLGITPYNVGIAFCGLALLTSMRRGVPRQIVAILWRPEYRLWSVFLLAAAAAAWILPIVFDGVPVHPLLAKSEVAADPVPNHFSLSHVAQSINSLGLLVALAWAALRAEQANAARALCAGLVAALVISASVSFYHRGALMGAYPLAVELWGSNPSYNQHFTSSYGPAYGRASLPFIEPSYASVWFAAAAAGTLAAALAAHDRLAPRAALGAACVLACAALMNTMGTSGLAAFVLALPVILTLAWFALRAAGSHSVVPVAALGCAAVGTALFLLCDYKWWQLSALEPIRAAIDFTLLKIEWAPMGPRFWSTQRALAIAIETFGLGVGPGSTRASSYLVGLMANLGVIGTGLFLLALVVQLRRLGCLALRGAGESAALFGATVAVIIGAFGGVSDQNWPVLWMLLLTGALVTRRSALLGVEPAQHLPGDGRRIE
jgi:hypothetical protein